MTVNMAGPVMRTGVPLGKGGEELFPRETHGLDRVYTRATSQKIEGLMLILRGSSRCHRIDDG